jgi:DNA-directed RNA polymerase subunit alpha
MSSNLFLNNHPEVKANLVKNSDQNYTLVIEPLYPGYGYTIGNSLRRIFLSSIPGFGITKIKINDLTHEYQPVAGLVEDALQVILNLKMVRARIKTDEERVTMSFSRSAAGTITAGEFKSAHAEIINKDLHICTLNKGSKLDIEIEISRGVGYLSMDDVNLSDNKDARQILVDTVFSPVSNVLLNVSKVRVGDKTNFDKVEINFDIDGSVDALQVVDFALDIMANITSQARASLSLKPSEEYVSTASPKDAPALPVNTDEIDLPEKIRKILIKNEITTNAQLKSRIEEVSDFTGIGAKALEEVQTYLSNL